jgi:TonB family protein
VEISPPPVSDSGPAAHPTELSESTAEPDIESGNESGMEGIAEESPTAGLPDAVEAHEVEDLPESPVREVTPVVEPQQEVVSKLALLSSIKQRRAVAMRPEPASAAAAEPEIVAPTMRQDALSKHIDDKQHADDQQPIENTRPVREQPQARVARKEPVEQKVREHQKRALPISETQRNSAEIARGGAPGPASKPLTYSARAGVTPFTPVDEHTDTSGKPKSFAASGAGMAVIGGAVLAIGLTAYLLMGHGTRRAASSPKPAVTASVQAPPVSTPAPASPAAGKSSPEKPPEAKPLGGPTPVGTSRPEDLKKEEKAPAKIDTVQAAKPPALTPPANPGSPPPAAVEAPRAVARTFAPPTDGARPADSTIVETPPALSAAAPSAPAIATLPARVAPPPPPSTAPRSSVPQQISVPAKVQATRLVKPVTPVYPPLARATRVQGVVRFRATIATDGHIKSLTLLGGPPPLVQGATDAVKQWRYQPTIVNGESVEVVTDIEVAFTL